MSKTIICYRRGCHNIAQWEIPGHPVVYLCTPHFRALCPNVVLPEKLEQQREVGPTELKEDEDGSRL